MKEIIFVPLVLITAILAFQKAYSAVLLDRVVATVNNEVITWSELMSVISLEGETVINNLSEEEKKKKMKELERPFLNNLIEMKLQLQEARKMGLKVSDSEIDGAINDIKKKFNMTDETLMNSLKAERMTFKDYRTRLAEQILLQKVVNFAIKSNIVITDKEIEEYYKANKEKYDEKEKLRIRQIFFIAPKEESQRANIESKAQNIIQKINEGEDFAKLAKEFSEDQSRKFGGDLGYVTRGSALKEIEEVASALKIGEVSKPFWSPVGLHIIKLEDRIKSSDIEKIRDRIKETLFQQAFKLKYREWITGLKEKAYVEIKL